MTQEDVSENFNRRWLIRLVTLTAIMFVGGLAIKSLFGNYFMARDAAFSYRQKTFSERAMAVHQDYLAGSRNGVACMKVCEGGGKSGSERICLAVSSAGWPTDIPPSAAKENLKREQAGDAAKDPVEEQKERSGHCLRLWNALLQDDAREVRYWDLGKGVCRYEDPLKQGLFVYDPESGKIR